MSSRKQLVSGPVYVSRLKSVKHNKDIYFVGDMHYSLTGTCKNNEIYLHELLDNEFKKYDDKENPIYYYNELFTHEGYKDKGFLNYFKNLQKFKNENTYMYKTALFFQKYGCFLWNKNETDLCSKKYPNVRFYISDIRDEFYTYKKISKIFNNNIIKQNKICNNIFNNTLTSIHFKFLNFINAIINYVNNYFNIYDDTNITLKEKEKFKKEFIDILKIFNYLFSKKEFNSLQSFITILKTHLKFKNIQDELKKCKSSDKKNINFYSRNFINNFKNNLENYFNNTINDMININNFIIKNENYLFNSTRFNRDIISKLYNINSIRSNIIDLFTIHMDVYILARIFKIRAENRTANKIIIHAGDNHIRNLESFFKFVYNFREINVGKNIHTRCSDISDFKLPLFS